MNASLQPQPQPHPDTTCSVCSSIQPPWPEETASVAPNVRAFAQERFGYFRCATCQSIHARGTPNLAHYYREYPFHSLPEDWRTRAIYDARLARLTRAGLTPAHDILDYGSGNGGFVRHLRRRGYLSSQGYDEYSAGSDDRAALARSYDFVLSQDVLEHVPDPVSHLAELHRLTRPGGVVAIGTPNASAIDLRRPERYRHTLHAPYHRHILSREALLAATRALGWQERYYYPTQYANTRIPFLNSRFYLFVLRVQGDTLEGLIAPALGPLLLRLPVTVFWALFGFWFAEETDIMVVFRRGS